jgi:hypothetical protein
MLRSARGAIDRARGRDSRAWRHVAVAAAVVGIVAAGWQVGHLPSTEAEPAVAQAVLAGTTLQARSICDGGATSPFTPTRISVQDVVRKAPVLALARDGNNVPGVPPLSEAGKHEFAWDRPPGILPGSAQGNVLLNAHTWPWTSAPALGNLMLEHLRVGDRIVLFGTTNTGTRAHLCYQVTKQVSIPAEQRYADYWVTDGPPQVAIMVCSGVRRGPGDWAERTVWFASPVTEEAPNASTVNSIGE